jgi:flavodoxin
MSRNLIIYFSRRGQNYYNNEITFLEKGNSEKLAEFISEITGADMFEIRTVKEYPEDSGSVQRLREKNCSRTPGRA